MGNDGTVSGKEWEEWKRNECGRNKRENKIKGGRFRKKELKGIEESGLGKEEKEKTSEKQR